MCRGKRGIKITRPHENLYVLSCCFRFGLVVWFFFFCFVFVFLFLFLDQKWQGFKLENSCFRSRGLFSCELSKKKVRVIFLLQFISYFRYHRGKCRLREFVEVHQDLLQFTGQHLAQWSCFFFLLMLVCARHNRVSNTNTLPFSKGNSNLSNLEPFYL